MAGSVHGTNDYMRWVGRSQEERAEQRKAARLCLDTSAHAGSDFQRLVTVLSHVSHRQSLAIGNNTALPHLCCQYFFSHILLVSTFLGFFTQLKCNTYQKIFWQLQATLQSMDVDQKSPTPPEKTALMVSPYPGHSTPCAAETVQLTHSMTMHRLNVHQLAEGDCALGMHLQDVPQSSFRPAGSPSPRQQSAMTLAALPAIPESSESAMHRAMSSGEEGRRGQRAYASFLESAGAGLHQVCMFDGSKIDEPSFGPRPWQLL